MVTLFLMVKNWRKELQYWQGVRDKYGLAKIIYVCIVVGWGYFFVLRPLVNYLVSLSDFQNFMTKLLYPSLEWIARQYGEWGLLIAIIIVFVGLDYALSLITKTHKKGKT